MINKNSSGGNLSANYDDYISQPAREFRVRILIDGSELSCAISQMVITKGSCGNPESFTVGNIVTSTMMAELKDVSVPIKGKTLQVQVGLFTGSQYEYVTMGHFVATDVSVNAYKTSVVAYGATSSKTNGSFVIPSTLSLRNIASAVSTATGVSVSFGNSIDTSKVINGELPIGCSCYQALQIMASVVGGYCMDTYDGGIVIKTFSATTTLSVDSDRMIILPSVGELPFNISGVKVVVTEAMESEEGSIIPEVSYEYPQGGNIVLYDTNPYMSAGCFDIYKQIVGYSYRNGNVRLSLGDPRIEGDDVLSVSDVSGETYVVPCHQVTHTYDGGFSTVVVASKPTSQAEGVVTTTPISQRIDVIASASAQALLSAEVAEESARQAQESAESAQSSADSAQASAESAQADASTARTKAEQAVQIVEGLEDEVDDLSGRIDTAESQISTAESNITTIQGNITNLQGRVSSTEGSLTAVEGRVTSLQGRMSDAEEDISDVESRVSTAETTVRNIEGSLDDTIHQLSLAEDVVGTINWITSHGTMTLSSDTTVNPSKIYFVRDNNGDYSVGSYRYSIVDEPTGNPHSNNYYELTLDSSVNNYIASHVALTNSGLVIMKDNSKWKVLVKDNGIDIIDNTSGLNRVVAQYSDTVTIGNSSDAHLQLDYHAMELIDRNGSSFVDLRDLRDDDGNVTIKRSGDGRSRDFKLNDAVSVTEVWIDGVRTTDYTTTSYTNYITVAFNTAPSDGAEILFKYVTSSELFKAFTLGIRLGDEEDIGIMSTVIGAGVASGRFSYAEGDGTTASGENSHAEGNESTASGPYASHAEGWGTRSTGGYGSHSEGINTEAYGWSSHSEGGYGIARGDMAHSEGYCTEANGNLSHAQNSNTIVSQTAQTALGTYNIEDTSTPTTHPHPEHTVEYGKYAVIVGNGDTNNRSNAFGFTWDGNIEMYFDTTQQSGTDHDLYSAITALGWQNDVNV